ncbi:MAG: glycerol-3-phosphate responsive antiterminator [Firmicutes bacterium]|uniref:Glycerol uptake operon antiterminator regulatory protein n=1 Tax=Melghirimyces thermohalophilus TaxID=1236220 RepID=A0A1G6HU86_9BACL|nr:glycerol-3-phosphate responsive antiterminator [Melghirimyces thermohalophilus]MDA8351718.1 glycerol-3-phosphate responsive antiterminator [Bacillota bacterium]SDB97760.1 glycerol uptake operon antiterminator [Melghirimyces thermohalophilus]
MGFQDGVRRHSVIAALKNEQDMKRLECSKVEVCFLLFGEINTLHQTVNRIRRMGKQVYLHVDLAQGFGNDRAALKYIRKEIEPDGVLSTRTHLIRFAREEGLFTIQRLFIPDTMSVETGKHLLKQSKADAVEVMPGVVPAWVYKELRRNHDIPIVAGGLLHGLGDIKSALENGADAISVSNGEIWDLTF